MSLLKQLTFEEDWGAGDSVLLNYLALQLRLSIEQDKFAWNDGQLLLTAGNLSTLSGIPIYVGMVRNQTSDENPWALNWVGDRPSCSMPPEAPCLEPWLAIDPAAEIVLGVELSESNRLQRVPTLDGATPAFRTRALVGACHFALHRGLAVPHVYGGVRSYFLPVYLESDSDLGAAPDLVCSVLVQERRLLIRSVLDPEVAYSHARAVVDRCDQLPGWLLESWAITETEGEED